MSDSGSKVAKSFPIFVTNCFGTLINVVQRDLDLKQETSDPAAAGFKAEP